MEPSSDHDPIAAWGGTANIEQDASGTRGPDHDEIARDRGTTQDRRPPLRHPQALGHRLAYSRSTERHALNQLTDAHGGP
eukprot:6296060-Pyramimonas_sp.AAC.1